MIADPLMALLSKKIDAHKDQDVRRALAPFVAMGERTRTALQLVRHLSKGENRTALLVELPLTSGRVAVRESVVESAG